MKCPRCGKELSFDKSYNCYTCNAAFCGSDFLFSDKLIEFKKDVCEFLTGNRLYGDICLAIEIEERNIFIQTKKCGPLPRKNFYTFGPISVDNFGISMVSSNALAFEFDDTIFPGFIAECKDRDTAYFIYRLILTLKRKHKISDLDENHPFDLFE